MEPEHVDLKEPKFDGQVTIKVRFRNKIEYEKFRKYILKTLWSYGDVYPTWEELTVDFHSVEDLEQVTRRVVELLQIGFEVYCCRYKLEEQLAEEEFPKEDDEEPEDPKTYFEGSDFTVEDFCKDLWRALKPE